MTAAYALPSVQAPPAALRRTKVPYVKACLIQTMLCVAPAMACVAVNRARIGAIYFLVVLFTCELYYIIRRNPLAASVLAIGTLPVWMLLRRFFFYNSIEIALALCVFAWVEGRRSEVGVILKDRIIQYFTILMLLNWLLAFYNTGDYSANLRGFELLFSALNVRLLGRHRRWLATALLGVAISVVAMGFGLLPYGSRLGMAQVTGGSIGNPISFGVPAALILLASLADSGRWLLFQGRPWLRIVMDLVIGLLLLLSTSRGSWLVLAVGMGIIVALNRRQRKLILSTLALMIIGGALYVQLDRDALVIHYLHETFSPDESWSKRTTGRADQWAAFPRVLHDSPVWGFGPGNGRRTSFHYAHKDLVWHSLYLHVGAEAGLIGLSLLAILLGALIRRAWLHYRRIGEIMPLIGIAGFALIGVSVPGFDGLSGMFFGLALVGCEFSRVFFVRRVVRIAQ